MRYKAIKIILASVSEPSLITYSKFLFLIVFIFISCRERVTPPDVPRYISPIMLAVEDASCSDAYIRIKTTKAFESGVIQLRREGSTRIEISNISSQLDTLVIDEGLLPKRDYRYTAYRVDGGVLVDSSAELRITTMDTTSHEFRWEIDTLGDGASSVLYDVAIINDTLAYAVGEIYKRDSLGNWDPTPYNAARWNGERWELLRVPAYIQGSTWYLPLRCITAFGPNDIWFEAGIHWDGTRYNTVPYTIDYPARINKSWGTSNTDLYVVGDGGLIAHYDGTRWRRIESGTTLPIMDVYGTKDSNGRYEILAVAEEISPGGSKILSIENTDVRELQTNGLLSWGLWGIWFVPKRQYITVGDGLWHTRLLDGTWYRNGDLPAQFKTSIDGQGLNDIVVCGAFWLLAHWNGLTWQTYFPRVSNSFTAVQIKDNLIIAVGGIGNKAVAVQGRR